MKHGQVHDYIGIDLDYSTKGDVNNGIIKYLQNVADKFPEPILGTEKLPAGEHMLQVRKDTDHLKRYLEETRAVQFHRVVSQLLFVSSHECRDIQTTISFLTSCVKKTDEDDWGNLVQCMKYLKGTKYMQLTLMVDTMYIIKWWVDESHHNHMDFRENTGAMMYIGKGAAVNFPANTSSIQKS